MLTVVVLSQIMALLDSTIVNVALKSMSVALSAPVAGVQWVITAYLLAFAAVTPVSGWVMNRFGAPRVYGWAIVLFTAGSLLCGFAGSLLQLICFRAVQGIGGGLMIPVGQALLIQMTGRDRLARVMSLLGVPTVLAPVFGPTIGGLLVTAASWRWIFFVNVPIGLAAIVLAKRMAPPWPTVNTTDPLDWRGLVLISTGLGALTYGLTQATSVQQVFAARTVATVLAGLVLTGFFILHSVRSQRPLLPLHMYRNATVAWAAMSVFCVGALLYGGMILLPLYYQNVRGIDAVYTGLLLVSGGAGSAVGSWATARSVERFGSGATAVAGAVIGVAGTIPFCFISGHTAFVLLGILQAVRGAGIALTLMPSLTTAYQALGPEQISAATPQFTTVQRIGAALGVAVFAVVLQDGIASRSAGSAAGAYADAFRWVSGVALILVIPAALMSRHQRRPRQGMARDVNVVTDNQGERSPHGT
jgi:EmrB/QacA subfamily drug resistance transporter